MNSVTDEERRSTVRQMYSRYKRRFAGVNDISAEELLQLQSDPQSKIVLVDCRKPQEMDVSVMQGHVVTPAELEDMDLSDPELQIVFYCTVGYRSGLAAKKFAKKSGIPKNRIYNLAGSCLSWAHAGGKLVSRATGEVVKKLHVVSVVSVTKASFTKWTLRVYEVWSILGLGAQRV